MCEWYIYLVYTDFNELLGTGSKQIIQNEIPVGFEPTTFRGARLRLNQLCVSEIFKSVI